MIGIMRSGLMVMRYDVNTWIESCMAWRLHSVGKCVRDTLADSLI